MTVRRFPYVGTVCLVPILFATACNPPLRTDCTDGVDNDGDGVIDGADPGCGVNGDVETPDPLECNDGVDNDGDGLVDRGDFGCEGADDDDEQDPITACNDNADNDGDMRIDFPDDEGCESPVDDDEFNPAQCQDGIDNDGDTRIDFPNDPGCTTEADDDETSPVPLPACADGDDNDDDDLVDFPADPGCASAADEDEFNVVAGACGPILEVVDIGASGEAMGTIAGPIPNELTSLECNGFGGEFAYTYTIIDGPKALVVTTDHPQTTLDTIVYVRTECRDPDTELGCDDDGGMLGGTSKLIVPEAAAGTYYVIVDALGPGSLGDFKLTVTERAGLGAACDPAHDDVCLDGLICREFTPGAGFTCERHVCEDMFDNDGDGVIDFPDEPGCADPLDGDETDPDPLPECANGIDDDGDAVVDYPADPGCRFAADDAEIDECIPGIEMIIHPGGRVDAVTGGASEFTAPPGCGFNTHLGPEDVYAHNQIRDLESITFSTEGSELDTVLYVRESECGSAAASVGCNDNAIGLTSKVTIASPSRDYYFAFVDSKTTTGGAYTLSITGQLAGGADCDPASADFVCGPGFVCDVDTCVATQCNDGVDNDDPEDALADELDPGCASISDLDEADPDPLPQCGNGADDDGDSLVDFPADPGCSRAGDDAEDECIAGVDVIPHAGGLESGTTVGGTTVLAAPSGCGFGTAAGPERVYVFDNDRTLDSLVLDTAGSALDTVLYVRVDDCAIAGPASACNDDWLGTASRVVFNSPALGAYFAVVDSKSSLGAAYDLKVSGVVAPGEPCDAADQFFACRYGFACSGGICAEAACNDGVDNDGDGVADDFDPGCVTIDDNDETDPAVVPECANGLDDDGDLVSDYPDDPDCRNAADDREQQTLFLAADGKSGTSGNLYAVNPATAATTVIGPIGFPVTGMAICPDGSVYGSLGRMAKTNDVIAIDPTTAAGTAIGPTGLDAVPDLTCLPDGRLLGWTETGDQAIEIDRATGAITALGVGLGTASAGSGIASDTTGTVVFLPSGCSSAGLFTVDTTTGTPIVGPPVTGCAFETVNSMTFFEGTLYAADATRMAGTPTQLGTIDTATGAFTPIGALPDNVDAIAGALQ